MMHLAPVAGNTLGMSAKGPRRARLAPLLDTFYSLCPAVENAFILIGPEVQKPHSERRSLSLSVVGPNSRIR